MVLAKADDPENAARHGPAPTRFFEASIGLGAVEGGEDVGQREGTIPP